MHWVLHQPELQLNFLKAKDTIFLRNMDHLAAVTPGTPGGLCIMLAEYGTMSLKEVLAACNATGRRLSDGSTNGNKY